MHVIDLRSDTTTLPTQEMRKAMYEAEVGDDSRGDDPTVKRLDEMAADITGKEAALLVPSGTMGNLISALIHCQRGDEMIIGSKAHMYLSESAGASTLPAIQARVVPNDSQGRLSPDDVEASIRPDAPHFPRTSLVCLENTQNACSGGVLSRQHMKAVCDVAHQHGIPVHLDGARIFNASVYLGIPTAELVQDIDDLCFCLSKGLSAPVGSLFCSTEEFVKEARRARQMLGGAMRQSGIIGAAGIVALNTMVDRLAEDHENAQRLSVGLSQIPGLSLNPENIQTNIVIFSVDSRIATSQQYLQKLAEKGIKVLSTIPGTIRMVTHRHITSQDIDETIVRANELARELLVSV